LNYAQSLWNVSNNLAEVYVQWCRINLERRKELKKLVVIGDLLLVIQEMINQGIASRNKIISRLNNIKHLSQSFEKNYFFHVKRGLSEKVDSWEKKVKSLQQGSLPFNGVLRPLQIP
jgi:hypothetical protein